MGAGDSLFAYVLILVAAAGLLLAGLVFGMAALMQRMFRRVSGLAALAERYPADSAPSGEIRQRQRIRIGAVDYRNCVDLSLDAKGLWFNVRGLLGKGQPVLIPWSEFGSPQPTRFYLWKSMRLSVGRPPVTTMVLPETFFEKIEPYLDMNAG
jgi:hypothetical protein